MLEKQVERLRQCQLIDTIVVATPDDEAQKPIWDWLAQTPMVNDLYLAKGSEDDVLARVLKAAKDTKTDIIVEVTGDEPLIDPFLVDLVTSYVVCEHEVCVNVGANEEHSWPKGMDVRAFRTEVLEDSEPKTCGQLDHRSNVSTYLYRKENEYDVRYLTAPDGEICPLLNLSVDEEDDYKRVKDIYETLEPLNPNFRLRDVLQYLATLPTYYELVNAPKLYKQANWLQVAQ